MIPTLWQHLSAAGVASLIVTVVIPVASALLAREHWKPWLVGLLTLVLSTANGFFATWAQQGDGFQWKVALGTTAGSFVLAVIARIGIWKDPGVDAALLAFPRSTSAQPAQPAA